MLLDYDEDEDAAVPKIQLLRCRGRAAVLGTLIVSISIRTFLVGLQGPVVVLVWMVEGRADRLERMEVASVTGADAWLSLV